jgi:leucyl-tRNA synthetase
VCGVQTKVQQKSGKEVYQWRIMESMGVPEEEIPAFADPVHWLRYFPPRALVHHLWV